jgi:flagellar biogenesis protein FliO
MEITQQIVAIGAVFALLAAVLWWLRRRGIARFVTGGSKAAAAGPLELAARLSLGPQHSLHLVRVGGRGVLIGRSPAGLTVIESMGWSDCMATDRGQARDAR